MKRIQIISLLVTVSLCFILLTGVDIQMSKGDNIQEYNTELISGFRVIEINEEYKKDEPINNIHTMDFSDFNYLTINTFKDKGYITLNINEDILELRKNPNENLILTVGAGKSKDGEHEISRSRQILIDEDNLENIKVPVIRDVTSNEKGELDIMELSLGFYNEDNKIYRRSRDLVIYAPDINDSTFIESDNLVNYEHAEKTKQLAEELRNQSLSDEQFIMRAFMLVTETNYDYELIENGLNDRFYISDPDKTLETGKGICSDQAILLTAILRSQGIPTKYVIGTEGDGWHAWNEILINGVWVSVDPTFETFYISDEHKAVVEY